jgi:FkbM family methyltransferase
MDVVGKGIGLAKRLHYSTGAMLAWERELRRGDVARRLIDTAVPEAATAVDVGCADGIYVERMLRLVGPRGTVYGVEPNPAHYDRLDRLARKHPNFRLLRHGASSTRAQATLFVPLANGSEHNGLASLRPMGTADGLHEVKTELVPLDEIFADKPGGIALVKIDVEGHESQVVRGARELISSSHPILLVEIEQRHHAEPIEGVIDEIAAHGYSAWGIGQHGLVPAADFNLERDQLRFLTGGFQNKMPAGYVNDFLFYPIARGDPPTV